MTKRTRLLALSLVVFTLLAPAAYSATLTTAQLTTLKNDILADPTLSQIDHTSNAGYQLIANAYNAAASPAFTVWKTFVLKGDIGKTFNPTDLAGLTSLNTTRLQNLADWNPTGINPSSANMRQFFDDIFSGAGGANTRAALLALWKRTALRGEKLFATGTGSDASPATLVVEGTITADNISAAFN